MSLAESLYALAVITVRQPREISLTAASTLATLERSGPRRVTELAASEGVTQPSMTAMVSGLERAGYVQRRPDPLDLRAVLVTLTRTGQSYLRHRRKIGSGRFTLLIDKLPEHERETLMAAAPALAHLVELEGERCGQT